ncbi:aryl hydrocarbon receptor nuclear translocator-like protein 2 isoform X2 [Denticeps clupeoides]|uniref:aryl hydrocarbon receptor nuclear translocator-like protein 2 isoform X2 n=1 Tax=Denticeps clupeoides TaxID=299321 RepID=UPI0010A5196B|nr:aryl hydrocarbon receptor nuclear translocator-like protein 2 isoform X2 [Denticeps clupeoides]
MSAGRTLDAGEKEGDAEALAGGHIATEDPPGATVPSTSSSELPRKRKGKVGSPEDVDSEMQDEVDRSEGDDQQVKIKCFREPHSRIEKRRRDKLNNLIEELSVMIPACNPLTRKLDKLTVLRMAVQHLKTLKGPASSFADTSYSPSFLPEDELGDLLQKAADGFLFVVSCDSGKIIFASESVSQILSYSRVDLVSQSLFDYIHPKDISKVKEQLSASELFPREQLSKSRSGEMKRGSHICKGARRSFFCRMKHRGGSKTEEKPPPSSKKKESQRYRTVHYTGYMRSWPTSQLDAEDEQDDSPLTCLVAVGRVHNHSVQQLPGEVKIKPAEFVTRYAIDGKFTYVDQRATTVLGYLPQELLGASCYEYFHQEDLAHLAERHHKVLRSKEKIETNCYRFKTKQGSYITLQSQWFCFMNPWSKEVEFIVSTNTVFSGHEETGGRSDPPSVPRTTEDEVKHTLPIIPGISSSAGTMIYAGSIGTQIANDFNRIHSPPGGNASPFTALQEKSPSAPPRPLSTLPSVEALDQEQPSTSGAATGVEAGLMPFPGDEALTDGSQLEIGPGSLNNDEVALLMSFLETDGNLGDVVDFDSLHWSL